MSRLRIGSESELSKILSVLRLIILSSLVLSLKIQTLKSFPTVFLRDTDLRPDVWV